MYLSVILIVLSTIGALLTLWEDNLSTFKRVKQKSESKEERIMRLEEKKKNIKTRRVKLFSSIFIIIALGLSIFQINQSEIEKNYEKDKLETEKRKQRTDDSTAYALLDTNYRTTVRAYEAQLLAGKLISSIKNKSDSIVNNLNNVDGNIRLYDSTIRKSLKAVDTSLNNYESSVERSTHVVTQSMAKLEESTNRLLYPLENVRINFRLVLHDSSVIRIMRGYISTLKRPFNGNNLPFYDSLSALMKCMKLEIRFMRSDIDDEDVLVLESNSHSYNFVADFLSSLSKPTLHNTFFIAFDSLYQEIHIYCENLDMIKTSQGTRIVSILDLEKMRLLVNLDFKQAPSSLLKKFNIDSAELGLGLNFSGRLRASWLKGTLKDRWGARYFTTMGPILLQPLQKR